MANSLKAKDLARLVLHKVQSGEDPKEVLVHMESYLEKVNRSDLYLLVLRYTKILYEQNVSRHSAEITSSHDIKSGTVNEIVEKLTDEKVVHRETVDKEMIGGFEAIYKDRKIGINLAKNIEAFKKHLTK
ncbi:MAG: hypothetical protein COV34_01935 [Candidatus Zambryskibacteria bacterium CG10_big_fil_rev_8_21_14_0_10_42_12]|uniref:Uncharacterized protein n=1 Tax=Candidatus Zambryskibacteria bacterium CG10_big_fil_rev_8_21_14_0_10_42_12 TaxID=1975115 RepID=A0A2H0QXI5_9BACT|nr:MAG: hypothetical protein COV34_01935 [Candidatus Zambryskibacteria bacterium CG10_big_fil_rev_8_21_14_0_10_42_12]